MTERRWQLFDNGAFKLSPEFFADGTRQLTWWLVTVSRVGMVPLGLNVIPILVAAQCYLMRKSPELLPLRRNGLITSLCIPPQMTMVINLELKISVRRMVDTPSSISVKHFMCNRTRNPVMSWANRDYFSAQTVKTLVVLIDRPEIKQAWNNFSYQEHEKGVVTKWDIPISEAANLELNFEKASCFTLSLVIRVRSKTVSVPTSLLISSILIDPY